jgi:predicted GNAT family N-acyltransferase
MASAAGLEVRWARDRHDVMLALRVREEVFCAEQGVPPELERDGLDERAMHLLVLDGSSDAAVGTLRLLAAGTKAKVGRVAVLREWRGRGIASRLLGLALERAIELGCSEARLASQLDATRLYERAGFSVQSDPFEQAGIAHVWMSRGLGLAPQKNQTF